MGFGFFVFFVFVVIFLMPFVGSSFGFFRSLGGGIGAGGSLRAEVGASDFAARIRDPDTATEGKSTGDDSDEGKDAGEVWKKEEQPEEDGSEDGVGV